MPINPAQLNDSKNEFNQAVGNQKGSALDKDSFMLLLVTQFKYQDPLNPMEDKEFIAQLAQFSSLEQLMNLNDSMGTLTDATNSQQMLNATSYIGKTVLAAGTSISKTGDSVTKFQYALSEQSASGVVNVYDSN
ncbi:MAG: flagellar hook capping FlgD N-terminal domain-containing protein, partial [Desulfovibrionaceae bacterium]